jgi:drug/metabolite transporter (DMT)-like permease
MITNDLDKYDPKGDHLMGWKDFFRLVLLASLWGASFLFIRIAVAPLGPFLLMDLRVLIASGTLMLYAFFLRRLPDLQKRWKEYLLLGTINSAIPFTLIATSELYITSSLAAILNATTPMFTAVVAALWLKDPLTWKKGAGLLLGFIGVTILVGWSPVPMEEKVLLAIGAMLAASFSYAIGGVYAKKTFPDASPLAMAIGQLTGAAVALLPAAAVTAPSARFTLFGTAATLGLAILSTAVAYLLYFRLLHNVGPTKTMTVTFLVPLFSLLWGVLLLDEPLGAGVITGFLLICAGIVFVADLRLGLGRSSVPTQSEKHPSG